MRKVLALMPADDPLNPPPGTKNTASFLFEVKVLLALLAGLKADGWSLGLAGKTPVALARAPRPKKGVSWFTIKRRKRAFQIVSGAQIIDKYGDAQAPDISLQRDNAGDEPTFNDVLAIWDAKLRGDGGAASAERISKHELAAFVLMHEVLGVPRPGDAEDALAGWPPAFEVPGLISNGRRPTTAKALLLNKGVSVAAKFSGSGTQCAPSRTEHVDSRQK